MSFKLAVIARENLVTSVAAYGTATISDFQSPERIHFDTLLGAEWTSRSVTLDMDAVPYLDSAAIGWLIGVQKQFRQGGGFLVLHSVQPHVRNLLNMLKVEKIVPFCIDGPAARRFLEARGCPQAVA